MKPARVMAVEVITIVTMINVIVDVTKGETEDQMTAVTTVMIDVIVEVTKGETEDQMIVIGNALAI